MDVTHVRVDSSVRRI
jgi:hypothetical protein